MNNYYDYEETDGNKKITTRYTVDEKALQYTIIGDNIRADFDFINVTIPDKLDEMLSELSKAAAINGAFYFNNGSSVSDITHAYEEILADVEEMKIRLNELRQGFDVAIDNVNAELENNFGYWAFTKANVAGRTVEEVPVTEE